MTQNAARRLRAGVAAGVLAGLLAACGSSSGSQGGSITLYNGQHPQTTAALVSAFEKQTGIQVKVRSADEDVLADQLAEEGSASPADVYFAENSPALESVQGKGLLAPLPAATLARVPARFNSPKGDWVGVSARVSVIVYNPSLLPASQLPRSIMDLAGPPWKGKLALAPAETDFQPVVTSVAHTFGEQATLRWLQGLKANAANHVYPDNEAALNAVNKGQVAIAVANHYYWYRQRAEAGPSGLHSAIAYFAPGDPGYVLDVSGAGVISSSHDKVDAQRFVAFLVSRQGQEIIAHSDQSFEYPLGSGVTTAQPLRPFDSLQPAPLTIEQLGDGATARSLLQQAQLL